MKFLIMGMPGKISIPPQEGVALVKATQAWMEERIERGAVESSYLFLDRGGFSIVNANSHEELYAEMLTYPLYPFFEWEVKALCDWKESFQGVIELYEKIAVP